MGDFERELRALEARVYALPVGPLEARVSALEQADWQIGASPGGLCIRSYVLSMTGENLYALPAGEEVAYGPVPYDPATTRGSGFTDSGGVVRLTTFTPSTSGDAFTALNPRFNFPLVGASTLASFPASGSCGDTFTGSQQVSTDGTGDYVATNLPTPYPLKTTIAVDVPLLSIVGLVLTWGPDGFGSTRWIGTGTASFSGCGGSSPCAAQASLPVTITLYCEYGQPYSTVQFDCPASSVGSPAHSCPDPAGPGTLSMSYGAGGGSLGTAAVSGDGTDPAGLSVTITSGSLYHAGPLFCGANPAPDVTFREV